EYINRWHGKHPTPYDFFNTFNNSTGQDLNWFFKPWFFEMGYPDLALKSVEITKAKSGSANKSDETWKVVIERKGNMPVPVDLVFVLQNDSLVKMNNSAAVWKDGKTEFSMEETLHGKLKEV